MRTGQQSIDGRSGRVGTKGNWLITYEVWSMGGPEVSRSRINKRPQLLFNNSNRVCRGGIS